MSIFLILFISKGLFAASCAPDEIYIREQWVDTYVKSDETKVSAHSRNAHCRRIDSENYFQDSTSQTFKGIKTKIKKWKPNEKEIVEKGLKKIPLWLQKYTLKEILRGDSGGGSLNPASTIPVTKTLIIFDNFFEANNKQDILTHEVAHISFWDLNEDELLGFTVASGWIVNREKRQRIPPKTKVLPDSSDSVSEDFANHIELYYSSPAKLKNINSKSYEQIEKIIKQRN